MRWLIPLATALIASPATALDEPAPAGAPSGEPAWLGVQLDAGVPAGVRAAGALRPWPFLRVEAGVAYNLVAPGLTAAVTAVPFHGAVRPTLGVEAGHFFEGDASRFAGDGSAAVKKLLERVGYDYVSAEVGIEAGREDRLVFFLRVGVANLFGSVRDAAAALREVNPALRFTLGGDPDASGRIPSVHLGVVVFVL
jgi:hypothetical protein